MINWKYYPDGVIARQDQRIFLFRTADSLLIEGTMPIASPEADWITLSRHLFAGNETIATHRENLATFWKQPRLAVNALNLNLTDRCNLACVYCYAHGGSYDRITDDLSPEQAVAGIERALARADPEIPFRIEFFGGEPLLNARTMQAVLNWQRTSPQWHARPGGAINRISTNLTMMEATHREVLREGRMIASISIDGPAAIQDAQRPFKDGRGSFDPIIRNVATLREIFPEAVIVARMTIAQSEIPIQHLLERLIATDLFDYASIYPATWSPRNGTGHSHASSAFRRQFLDLAEAYPHLLRSGRFKGILEINRYLQGILERATVTNHCRGGSGYFTLSPDNSVHPCHRLVGQQSFDLGPMTWNPSHSDQYPRLCDQLRPWQTHVDDRPGCRECAIRYLCGGGCKQQALVATGDLLGHDPAICAFAHMLFESAMIVGMSLEKLPAEKLPACFAQLADLFVLCGQRQIKLPRLSDPPMHVVSRLLGFPVKFVNSTRREQDP